MFVLYLFCEGQTVLENIFLQGEVQGEKKTLKFRTRIKRIMLAKQLRVINQGKVIWRWHLAGGNYHWKEQEFLQTWNQKIHSNGKSPCTWKWSFWNSCVQILSQYLASLHILWYRTGKCFDWYKMLETADFAIVVHSAAKVDISILHWDWHITISPKYMKYVITYM